MNRLRHWLVEQVVPPLGFFLLVLLVWQTATTFWRIPIYVVPPPSLVLSSVNEHAGDLASATLITAEAALCGFAAGLVGGTALGLVFSQSRIVERSIYPYAIFLQTVPIVAIAPIVIIWFGAGFTSVVVVSFILSLFPILTNVTAGLTSVDPQLLELFAIYNASRWQTLVKLRLPNAVPHLVVGARISCGLSVIGAIVGELFAGYATNRYGLGYLFTLTTQRLETAYAFAAMFASTLLSIAIFVAVNVLGTMVLTRWHIGPTQVKTSSTT